MFKYKNSILTALSLMIMVVGFSQATAASVPASNPVAPTNYLAVLMLVVAGLLVLVIWVLSNVLFMIAKKAVEFSKSGNKVLMIGFIVMGSLFANTASAQSAFTDTLQKTPSINYYGGLSATTFWTLSTVLSLELFVVFILVLFIRGIWRSMYPALVVEYEKTVSQVWIIRTWNDLDKKFFTKAAPLEKEADMLLDHDYDGIKELDNALPPWWKYGFYITIFIAVLYLLKYEIWHNGPNPTEEYNSEMTYAKAQVDEYLASMKNNVDEKSVTMSDAAGIAAGQVTFSKTCVPCHGAKGEGGVGPNLTDDYWLHGGGVADLFKTIKYGYPDKGMQAWQSTYSPIQMQELASYIKTLNGTNPPNAKAPQGDLFNEGVAGKDSTSVTPIKDSVVAVK
jgi:cytochrome c oxidase cbb3-type subunit 3